MPKSAPSPTNRIAKAIEIRLKAPTSSSPTAAVSANPTAKVMNTATMTRTERSATIRIASTATAVPISCEMALALRVMNCASLSAARPISRNLAP